MGPKLDVQMSRERKQAARRAALLVAGMVASIAAGPAAADWREDYPVVRIGIMVGNNAPYRLAQVDPFRKYLAEALGVQVEMIPAANYAALIGAQVRSSLPLAFLSATAFASAEVECHCVEPLAAPVGLDGSRGFHVVLLARSDGPIRSLTDARSARVAASRDDSIGGRLLPLRLLADEGFTEKDFGSVVTEDDQRQAVAALFDGGADLAFAWSTLTGDSEAGYSSGVLTEMVADGDLSMDEVRIVWSSPLVPYGPLSVRDDVPDDLKLLVRGAMLDLARSAPDALDAIDRSLGGGFVAGDGAAYAPLRQMLSAGAEP